MPFLPTNLNKKNTIKQRQTSGATENKNLLLSNKYWLFNRDPYNGLLYTIWKVDGDGHPQKTAICQGIR